MENESSSTSALRRGSNRRARRRATLGEGRGGRFLERFVAARAIAADSKANTRLISKKIHKKKSATEARGKGCAREAGNFKRREALLVPCSWPCWAYGRLIQGNIGS